MVKRLIDIIGSSVGLILLSPLFLILSLAIKLESKGPLFYRGWRMGQGLKPFRVLKFRSMRVLNREGRPITAPGDSRITRVGAWLRLFKLDELPQLWNVLRAEMSLVGPRPEDVKIVERYYNEAQKRVLTVKPGLTGIGQVTFFPDMTREVPGGVDPHEFYLRNQLPRKISVDLMYVEKQSICYDLWIVARTVYCILVKSWLLI